MINIVMNTEFVIVLCDVHCQGQLPARYRAFVSDELFAERTWDWHNVYLEEMFQIQAVPGKYKIAYKNLDHAELVIQNWRVELGNAVIDQQGNLEILNAD
jgi:hypothetical protein